MASGSAFGSFVTGLFAGVNQGNEWSDRKRRQILEDEDYAFKRKQQQWNEADRARLEKQRAQEDADREAERNDRESAMAEANRIMSGGGTPQHNSSAPVGRSVIPSDSSAQTAAAPVAPPARMGSMNPADYGQGSVQPNPQNGEAYPVGAPVPNSEPPAAPGTAPSAPSNAAAASGPDDRAESVAMTREMQQYDPRAYTYEQWKAMNSGQRQQAGLKRSVLGGELQFNRLGVGMGAQPPRVQPGAGDHYAPTSDSERYGQSIGQQQADAMLGRGQDQPPVSQDASAAQPAPDGYSVGDGRQAPSGVQTLTGIGAGAGAGPMQAPSIPSAEKSPDIAPTPARARSVFSYDSGATDTPAAAAAAATLADDTPGQKTAGEPSVETRIANFQKTYRDVVAPKIMQGYIARGQYEKAAAFQKFVDDQKVKSSMTLWAKAAHAASIGDADSALSHLADYYNTIDDGYTVLKDRSKVLRDDSGNMLGIQLVFRNSAGKVMKQTINGAEDIMAQGIFAASPENTFTYLDNIRKSAAGVDAETAKQQAQTNREIAVARVKEGDPRTKVIEALQKNDPSWFQRTPEEQDAAIRQALAQRLGIASDTTVAPQATTYRSIQ